MTDLTIKQKAILNKAATLTIVHEVSPRGDGVVPFEMFYFQEQKGMRIFNTAIDADDVRALFEAGLLTGGATGGEQKGEIDRTALANEKYPAEIVAP